MFLRCFRLVVIPCSNKPKTSEVEDAIYLKPYAVTALPRIHNQPVLQHQEKEKQQTWSVPVSCRCFGASWRCCWIDGVFGGHMFSSQTQTLEVWLLLTSELGLPWHSGHPGCWRWSLSTLRATLRICAAWGSCCKVTFFFYFFKIFLDLFCICSCVVECLKVKWLGMHTMVYLCIPLCVCQPPFQSAKSDEHCSSCMGSSLVVTHTCILDTVGCFLNNFVSCTIISISGMPYISADFQQYSVTY